MAKPESDVSEDDGAWWRSLLRPVLVLAGCAVSAAVFVATMRVLAKGGFGFWWVMGAAALYAAAILAIVYFANRFRRRSCSEAKRRYEDRVMGTMSLYVVALIGAIGAFNRLHPTGVLAWALAIAVALPVVATVAIMGLYLSEESDEFERMVTVQGALWATGGVLSLATVWGFVELFGLAPHIQLWWAFPVWSVIFGPAQFIIRRRYR